MRTSLLLVTAIAAAALVPATAHAQPAFALGHPLEAPDADVGEISVRVIAGSVAKPVIGAEVTLTVGGTPRIARTDSAGRAFFKQLPPGTAVQASIKDEDGKDVQSDQFAVPDAGGIRVMLSTRPVDPNAMAGGAPFAGGAGGGPMAGPGGMPDPRKISGVGRPEQKNPPGTLTVRTIYDDLAGKVPNIPVTVVGYHADGRVFVVTKQTDADGRATFPSLDITGATAYYAMAQMPRNGALDRLVSVPITLEPQVGVALLLSAEKLDSTAPPVDDQGRLDTQNAALPAGDVEVSLDGTLKPMNPVTLVDALTHTIVGHVLPDRFPPDKTAINATADFAPRPDEHPGTLDVTVHGGGGSTDKPLAGVAVNVFTTDDTDLKNPFPGTTNASGIAHFDLKPGTYHAVITVNGKDLSSQGFDLRTGGNAASVRAQWEAVGRQRALFHDIAATPGQTLYAELVGPDGEKYKSAPFQMVAAHGTSASIRVVPILFTFHVITGVEDQLLAVQAQYSLLNLSWAPYSAGPDGLSVPLPRGFKGAQVADRDQTIAGVQAGVGFVVPRPLPPAVATVFRVGFSLPVDNSGTVGWAQDLPFGTMQSWMRMIQVPGMTVEVPKGTHGEPGEQDGVSAYQIGDIHIAPNQSMVLAIHGLPTPPAWKIWLPRFIGLLVIGLVVGGVVLATMQRGPKRPAADAAREARRARLLEELVELERSGKDGKRREALLTELEKLWDDSAA